MRVLITGAAGFIGSHLCERLLAAGHWVTGLDNFHDNYDPRIKRRAMSDLETHPRFMLIEGDMREPEALEAAFTPAPDAVVHLAALVGVRTSLSHAGEYADVNVRATTLVLEACRQHGVKRVTLASSSSVYGNSIDTPFREEAPLGTPLSPYAATKRAMEVMAAAYHHLYDINIAVLRFFTVYGARQRPDLAIHKFARLILNKEAIPVFGDGSSRRDYTHISDIVGGIEGAIRWTDSPDTQMETFNLASGRTVTLMEMIEAIEEAVGSKAILKRLPDQPGDMSATWADVSKAQSVLGLPKAVDFATGVRDFVQWLRADLDRAASAGRHD